VNRRVHRYLAATRLSQLDNVYGVHHAKTEEHHRD
jgi:hypothetical protein